MIDIYCERIDASFWSEPTNALTNIAFILAGIIAFFLLVKEEKKPVHLVLLASLMVIIGVGSFLFHTFANQWSLFADVIPIYLFQLFFVWAYQRYLLTFSIIQIVAMFALFIGAILLTRFLPFSLNGSEMYLPTVAIMVLFSCAAKLMNKRFDRHLIYASVIFSLSLVMRTIDQDMCQYIPLGTHFSWHLLNSGVLFLSWYSLFLNAKTDATNKAN